MSVTRFELPELLLAERAGRAMGLCIREDVEAGISPCLAGAAAMAGVRRARNRGFRARLTLTEAHAPGCEPFDIMLAVCRAMHIPILDADGSVHEEFPIAISGMSSSATRGDESFLVAERFLESSSATLWDDYSSKKNPFLRRPSRDRVLDTEAIRAVDRRTVEEFGLPRLCLMENAGIGAAVVAAEMLERTPDPGPVVILAGPGNNGGDGFVLARGLIEGGEDVVVLLLQPANQLRGDAAAMLAILMQREGVVQEAPTGTGALADRLRGARLAVDALFGTGLDRPLEGRYAEAVAALDEAGRPVLALDLPSGLDGNTGMPLGPAARADFTVTFAAPKPAIFEGEGPDRCGPVAVADIGCPRSLLSE